MAINDKTTNFNKEAKAHSCDEIRISRVDLKRKNYKNAETIKCKNVSPGDSRNQAGAEVRLLHRMFVEWREFAPGSKEEGKHADCCDICEVQ